MTGFEARLLQKANDLVDPPHGQRLRGEASGAKDRFAAEGPVILPADH